MRQMIIVVLAVVLVGFYSFYNPANVYAGDPAANIEQSPEAQFTLGLKYAEGDGVPQDLAEAAKWWRKAAEQGHAVAQVLLGALYRFGEGVTQDYEEAVKWSHKSAEQGNAGGQLLLGELYANGQGVPQDDKQAVGWYRKSAEQGDARAQANLGFMYANGKGVPQDYKEAAKWYRKSAEQGNAGGQLLLGELYANGQGVQQDYVEAVKWYRKSAEQGDARAQANLGFMYDLGLGVPQDYAEAAKWYRKAAEQGNAFAQGLLGEMYANGQGVPQDKTEAAKWYRKAAEQGNAFAQFSLGLMYANGKGVPQDYKEAAKWYRKAAEQGYAFAQVNLGVMYDQGKGVPQNYILAYAWLNLAAAQGEKEAPQNRDVVAGKMTPAQIAEAQKLSAQLQQEINRPSAPSDSKDRSPKTPGIPDRQVKGSGSGFIITRDGYVLTCQHVIDNAQSIEVAIEDNVYPAKLIREDKYNDLALLKISGTFPPLAFCSKRSAQMGQEVFTIGYPNPVLQGISAKLTKGTVASLTGIQDDLRLYQISVPVQPGNSGGPLLDLSGNILGVIVAILDAKTAFDISGSLPQNVNYAVKGAYAQALLGTLPEMSEKLPPPYREQPFTDVVDRVNKSVVMVLTY